MGLTKNLGWLSKYITADSAGKIGIGTASPNYGLNVVNSDLTLSGIVSNRFIGLRKENNTLPGYLGLLGGDNGDSALIIGYNSAGTQTLQINASTSPTYFNGGNVGIGTTSPSGAAGTALAINGGAGQTRIALKNNITGDNPADGFQILLNSSSADVMLENRENGYIGFATNDEERMRITSGGDVKLTVASSGTQNLYFGTSATNYAKISYNDSSGELSIGTTENYATTFLSSNTERMRITSAGNLTFNGSNVPSGLVQEVSGNTPLLGMDVNFRPIPLTNTTYPGAQVRVDMRTSQPPFSFLYRPAGSTVDSSLMEIRNTGNVLIGTTADNGYRLWVEGGGASPLALRNASATGGRYWKVGPDGASNFIIYNESNTGCYINWTSTSWTGNSDIRLKNIIKNIDNATESLLTLNPVIFSWKKDNTNKENLGLIAQDVEKVFPQVIDSNSEGMLGVRYTDLIPVLIASIQELTERIKTLENK